MPRGNRIPPDPGLLAELREISEGSPKTLAGIAGIKQTAAARLLEGSPMPPAFLEDVAESVRHEKTGPELLRLRMRNALGASRKSRRVLLDRLRACAEIVDRYHGVLKMGVWAASRSLFPPKSMLLMMSAAVGRMREFLKQVYVDMPEMRRRLFKTAPELRKTFAREVMGATAGVHRKRVRKVRPNAESRASRVVDS